MAYLKAKDYLPDELIRMVQNTIEEKMPGFEGGSVYFPSSSSNNVRFLSSETRNVRKVLAIIAIHDGFTVDEAAQMAGASRQTVANWKKKYSEHVIPALTKMRRERQTDG
jgi:DNA-binding XRE family transcriptional regulator